VDRFTQPLEPESRLKIAGSVAAVRKHKLHSADEICDLLEKAEQLRLQGQSQKTICNVLGISVMTYHRWRNRGIWRQRRAGDRPAEQLDDLVSENRMLRRIVSDLLIETMKLREAL
jgi:putative transposase